MGISTEQEAEKAKERIVAAMKNGEEVNIKNISTFVGHVSLNDLFKKTIALHWSNTDHGLRMQKMTKQITAILGVNFPVKDINMEVVDDFILTLKNNGNSNGTINRKLACLSKALNVAKKRNYVDHIPEIEWLEEGVGRVRFFTKAEENQLLAFLTQCGQHEMHDLVVFLMDTGLRRGEAMKLTAMDYLKDSILVRQIANTKNKYKSRSVPLTKRAKEIVESRLDREGKLFNLSATQIRDKWNRARNHLGYGNDPEYVLHTLRHSCASRLVQGGIGLQVVKEWLGHNSLSMVLRYSHLVPKNLLNAVNVLEVKEVA
tara:strand:- start:5156 stop:6103 length:948 start_codon:yes stop_codon:yes gene_type:complete